MDAPPGVSGAPAARTSLAGRPSGPDREYFGPPFLIEGKKTQFVTCKECGRGPICNQPKSRRRHLRICESLSPEVRASFVDLPKLYAYGDSEDEGGGQTGEGLPQDPLTVGVGVESVDPSRDGAVSAHKIPQKQKGKAKDSSRARGRALDWAMSCGLSAEALHSVQFMDVLACFGPVAPTTLAKLEEDVPASLDRLLTSQSQSINATTSRAPATLLCDASVTLRGRRYISFQLYPAPDDALSHSLPVFIHAVPITEYPELTWKSVETAVSDTISQVTGGWLVTCSAVSSVVIKCDAVLAKPANISALCEALRIPVIPCLRQQMHYLLSILLLELPASSSVGSVWYSAVGDSLKGSRHIVTALTAVNSPILPLIDPASPEWLLQFIHTHRTAIEQALKCDVPDPTSPFAVILNAQLTSARGFVNDESFWNALSWVHATVACVCAQVDELCCNAVPLSRLRKVVGEITESVSRTCQPSTVDDVKRALDATFAPFSPLSDAMFLAAVLDPLLPLPHISDLHHDALVTATQAALDRMGTSGTVVLTELQSFIQHRRAHHNERSSGGFETSDDVQDHVLYTFRQLPADVAPDGHTSYDWWCSLGFRIFPSLYPVASVLVWPPVAVTMSSQALTHGLSRHLAVSNPATVPDPLGAAVKLMQVYSFCRRNNVSKLKKSPAGVWDSLLLQPHLHQGLTAPLHSPPELEAGEERVKAAVSHNKKTTRRARTKRPAEQMAEL